MDKIITSNTAKTALKFKVKILYDNGANETIYPTLPPNVNPVTPVFMSFRVKDGFDRHINMSHVRSMDIEISQESEAKIIQ